MPTDAHLLRKFSPIKLLVLDVDGVLTDGSITYTSGGEEIKTFFVRDGYGLMLLAKQGMPVAIITGRGSPIVERRASELKIPYVFQNVKEKLPVLEQLCEQLDIGLDEVAFVGDDLPDFDAMQKVGLACCPADAMPCIKEIGHFTSQFPGGRGAVREVVDLLLEAHAAHASRQQIL